MRNSKPLAVLRPDVWKHGWVTSAEQHQQAEQPSHKLNLVLIHTRTGNMFPFASSSIFLYLRLSLFYSLSLYHVCVDTLVRKKTICDSTFILIMSRSIWSLHLHTKVIPWFNIVQWSSPAVYMWHDEVRYLCLLILYHYRGSSCKVQSLPSSHDIWCVLFS